MDLLEEDGASSGLTINQSFADNYQTKKRGEELSKLQDKYGKDYQLEDDDDDDSEDLSTDDSDAEFVTPAVDVAILKTLAKIRNRDPDVYDNSKQIFDEEEARLGAEAASKRRAGGGKAQQPVNLRDFQRARLLNGETESSAADGTAPQPRTYAQEAEDLRAETKRAFLSGGNDSSSDGDSEDDDGLLMKRDKSQDEQAREDEEYRAFLRKHHVGTEREVAAALGDEDAFLRDYILKRGWMERSGKKGYIPSYDEVVGGNKRPKPSTSKVVAAQESSEAESPDDESSDSDSENEEATAQGDAKPADPGMFDSEDDALDERAEAFEHAYNFRFEDEQGAQLQTFARDAVDSVRRPAAAVSARARARERAREKKDAEKLERREEVRRLKALKRKEAEDKLAQIIEAGGKGVAGELDDFDLDGDFDEVKHDALMRKLYGSDYEAAQDEDIKVDDEGKPVWDDDIDMGDIEVSDSDADSEAAEKTSSKKKKDKKGKRKDKGKAKEEGISSELVQEALRKGGDDAKEVVDDLMDEYYNLDYEDKIGDLKTRFKYTDVTPTSFNLTPEELLLATDAELNAYVSLKRLAAYRKDEEKSGKRKKRLKELRDSVRRRQWGRHDAGGEGEPVSSSHKKHKKRTSAPHSGSSEGQPPAKKKRLGKKERSRLKAAAPAE